MKKMLLLSLLAVLAGPRLGWTATPTNTPTPNATQTAAQTQIQQTQTAIAATATYIATAFPTLTPTLTPTGTLTPSATFTPAPKQIKTDYRERQYIYPYDFLTAAGNPVNNTAVPGGTVPWLALSLSQTCAVLSTGSAEVRAGWIIPNDFKGDLKFFAYMNAQTVGDGVSLTVGVNGQHFNDTTQTVGTFSYTPPTGGFWYLGGTSTQVLAGIYNDPNCLWDTPVQVVSRVRLPTNAALVQYQTTNPLLPNYVKRGDFIALDILRASGGAGNVYIYGIEAEYDYYPGVPQ